MNPAVHIANARRPMTDEQRKAMFARMGGGGGGGRPASGGGPSSATPSQSVSSSDAAALTQARLAERMRELETSGGYTHVSVDDPIPSHSTPRTGYTPRTTMRDRFNIVREAYRGWNEGVRGGTTIAADRLTFGLIGPLSRAADSYQGFEYDVSRGASTVARESLLSAAGIGLMGRFRAAVQGSQYVPALAKAHLNPIMAVGGFGGPQLLEGYRQSDPIRHYHEDKALAMGSQLLGYVGAIGAFGSLMQYGGALARTAIPFTGGASVAGGYRHALNGVDRAFKAVSHTLGKALPASWKPMLSKAAAGQRWLSQFTGSTLKDLPRVTRAPGDLNYAARAKSIAGTMRQTADQHRQQAQRIIRDVQTVQDPMLQRLNESHRASMIRDPGARSIYEAARHDYYQTVQRGADQSRQTAQRMIDRADNLVRRAGQLEATSTEIRRGAYERIGKAALVTGGIVGTEIYDEAKIRGYRQEAYDALRAGDTYRLQQDEARGPLGTFLQTMVGFNLNNPGEKQFRPGRERWQSATGAYRAGYDAINEDYRDGHISATQRDAMLHDLAERGKPWNMQGRGLWTQSPAMAAYGEWKGREAIERGQRSTVAPTISVYDGDTITVDHRFPGQGPDQMVRGQPMDQTGRIRYLDIDAPELARTWEDPVTPAEYLGPESADRMKELIRPGQYVRVVQDSHDRASGLGVWGRQLGYVETLPRPFDNLLRIPYLGKVLPARDTGRTLLKEGLADIGYRQLSGRTDRAVSYDRARATAQAAERGIWSEEGRLHHPDAGQTKTVAERSDEWFRRQTGEERPPETFWDKALTPAAIGLMTTGNTGIFRDLTRSGPAISQLYNLTVAYLGAKNYNTRAARTAPMYAFQPDVRNFRQDERDRLLREAQERARAQAR